MNAKLEKEARMLSEEKGLPYEFVKGMLEFMEEESELILSEQTYSRPIPEKLTFLWVNEALEIFKSIIPSLDVSFTPIYTYSKEIYKEISRCKRIYKQSR